jgi:uncharacterized protein
VFRELRGLAPDDALIVERLKGGAPMSGSDVLLLHGLQPIHWAIAGGSLAAVTLALVFVGNRRLGISSGFEDVCSIVVRQPYFRRRGLMTNRPWRLPFVIGLVLGGFLSAVLSGGWAPTWALGMFDRAIGFGEVGKLAWMFAGGLLVGFGTRMGNGCTSGHGIFGLSNLEFPSLVATATFMTAGMLTTQLLYNVVMR